MINAILKGIISLIVNLVNVILSPIDSLILSLLPDLSDALTQIGSFFNIVSNSLGWCISLTGISSSAISLIVLYYTFKLTAPMSFYLIKLALSWYNRLKP